MVATKLNEVWGKGMEWYHSGDPNPPSSSTTIKQPNQAAAIPTPPSTDPASASTPSPSSSLSSSYWENYAPSSMQDAFDQTYSAVGSMMSSVFSPGFSSLSSPEGVSEQESSPIVENLPVTPRKTSNSVLTSPRLLNSFFHNPYISVRGGGNDQARVESKSSMKAVRTILSYVPEVSETNDQPSEASSSYTDSLEGQRRSLFWYSYNKDRSRQQQQPSQSSDQSFFSGLDGSPSEMASHLAEGTLRAFRDVALDEAVELHEALRYWSYRWERPLLSWLEAGPTVWFGKDGYNHQEIGWKVSQIQAVLARRCATVGDLQYHLLRAGWQRGVAQWGVLGDGGQWAAVTGVDGTMAPESSDKRSKSSMPRRSSTEGLESLPPPSPARLPNAPTSNVSNLPEGSRHDTLYYTKVKVQNNDGGKIYIEDPALAEWSIDALSIVRRHLFRAANGRAVLPYAENWSEGDDQSLCIEPSASQSSDLPCEDTDDTDPEMKRSISKKLPLWASLTSKVPTVDENMATDNDTDIEQDTEQRVTISNLPLMVSEVSEIIDSIETIMEIQRSRRLDKLRAPLWIRRNWYLAATILPPFIYCLHKLPMTTKYIKYTAQSLSTFFHEHVVEPMLAIYEELATGTSSLSFSDREARRTVIENLQKMIRAWLDENCPEMPSSEKHLRSTMMDMTIIEARNEESMKSLSPLNVNSVIRMSLIEAQFIKKEMMNAMLALDEMRASTNFNINIAAVTPFILMTYMTKRAFQFVFYATLRMGKSREEVYGSFLQILTEMERLLVMRDNPPIPPVHSSDRRRESAKPSDASVHAGNDTVLNADDLGMLMLHIHELKTILWKDRRRFSPSIIRGVAEDLAELAGERGAVSVRQQLQIIGRMSRTYPFLKVASSAIVFEYLQP